MHVAAQSNAVYALGFFWRNTAFGLDHRDKSQCTVLHWASQSLSVEAVRYLIAWKADINAKDEKQFTPLHLAVRHAEDDPMSAESIVYLLLEAGASHRNRDYLNKRAFDYLLDI